MINASGSYFKNHPRAIGLNLEEKSMQAIEFEAMTDHQHRIRIPDHVPEGIWFRVLLLFDDAARSTDTGEDWKALLTAMPDIGCDDDFLRPSDYGRDQSWDS